MISVVWHTMLLSYYYPGLVQVCPGVWHCIHTHPLTLTLVPNLVAIIWYVKETKLGRT